MGWGGLKAGEREEGNSCSLTKSLGKGKKPSWDLAVAQSAHPSTASRAPEPASSLSVTPASSGGYKMRCSEHMAEPGQANLPPAPKPLGAASCCAPTAMSASRGHQLEPACDALPGQSPVKAEDISRKTKQTFSCISKMSRIQ